MQKALAIQNAKCIILAMRTHADIIRDAGGPVAVHDGLGLEAKQHTVRSWLQRDSIPADHWKACALAGFATLDELATAAAAKRAEHAGLDVIEAGRAA